MNTASKTARRTQTLLIILLVFLSLSGLFGIAFLIDPSGALVEMPISLLDNLPIDTFLLPGLYLLLVYGLGAALIAFGLVRRLAWAPLAALLLGLVLIGWIIGQVLLWGEPAFLQVLYLAVGAGIFVLSWMARRQAV